MLFRKKPIIFATDDNGDFILGKFPFRVWFKLCYMPKYLSFVRWVLIDWIRGKPKKLFGIYMFCGLFGEGKTISMIKHAEEERSKDPSIKIYSNFGYKYADGEITDASQLLTLPHKSIVMLDEIHGTFDSPGWKNFPKDLLLNICQCRKRQIMLLCSVQYFGDVTVQIRRLAHFVIQCSNVGGLDRLFVNKYFTRPIYERWYDSQGSENNRKIMPYMTRSFVASDDLYDLYDTNQFVQSLKLESLCSNT